MRHLQSAVTPPVRPLADVNTVKADLCELFRAERAYFDATGSYATENELRSNGNLSIPTGRWPYQYVIYVPPENGFMMIVATGYGPLANRALAMTIDRRGQVCTVSPNMARFSHQLDNPSQTWGDAAPDHDCDVCK
jgi:hypothetical protein